MANTPCDYCGNPVSTIVDSETLCCMCAGCAQYLYTCALCSHSRVCDFATNPSPLPKQVSHTIQQGNTIIQTAIPNPERVAISCANGCICFDPNFGCLRQNLWCDNYKEVNPRDQQHS